MTLPDWAKGKPDPRPGQCPVFWRSKYSGLWLMCELNEHHEGECRDAGAWRDVSEEPADRSPHAKETP